MLRGALVAALLGAAVTALPVIPAAASRPTAACKYVTLADARDVLGAFATGPDAGAKPACMYTAPPTTGPTGPSSVLLVQAWSGPRPKSIPGTRVIVHGVPAWYFDPPAPTGADLARQSFPGTLTSYRKGLLFKVAVAGTGDDLGSSKVALSRVFERQRRVG